jgi:hypothetical protein
MRKPIVRRNFIPNGKEKFEGVDISFASIAVKN